MYTQENSVIFLEIPWRLTFLIILGYFRKHGNKSQNRAFTQIIYAVHASHLLPSPYSCSVKVMQ